MCFASMLRSMLMSLGRKSLDGLSPLFLCFSTTCTDGVGSNSKVLCLVAAFNQMLMASGRDVACHHLFLCFLFHCMEGAGLPKGVDEKGTLSRHCKHRAGLIRFSQM
jgi:hypothetical protein